MSVTASREHTAYHEAGHAVAAWHLLDEEVSQTTIRERGGNAGASWSRGPSFDGRGDDQQIVVLFAGHAAVCHLVRDRDLRPYEHGAGRDEDEAAELLDLHPEYNEEALRAQAHEIIEEHWRGVECVAAQLLADETLTCEEVDVILTAIADERDPHDALDELRARFGEFLDEHRAALGSPPVCRRAGEEA